MSEAYINVVKRYLTYLNDGDLEGVRSLYADDASLEDPVGSTLLEGIDAIETFYREGVMQAKVKATLSGEVHVAGREAAFPFEVVTQRGDRSTRISIIDVFCFDEQAKIKSMRAFWGPENFH